MGDGAAASRDADSPPDPPAQLFAVHTVAVIGAGRVGRSFALACAAAGFDVVLADVMPANLRRAQEEYADLFPLGAGGSSAGSFGSRGALEVALTVEDAVRACDLAIDFVPDELESKLEIFCLVDRMAPPKTILLTPSDALSITDLASCTYRGDRCFAMRGRLPGSALAQSGPSRLLHPSGAAVPAVTAVLRFLTAMGGDVRVETDPDAPMLTKNLGGVTTS
jgi:3-hydroxybutyryl-CoA dehydrogenase